MMAVSRASMREKYIVCRNKDNFLAQRVSNPCF